MRKRNGTAVKVLIADDDEIVREVLERSLSESGFDVRTAQDGDEAIRLLSPEVDVALFDLRMPGKSGFECLQYLSRLNPDSKAIIITASSDVSDVVRAMKEGAFDYLVKPLRAAEVTQLVKRLAELVRLRRENDDLRQAFTGNPSGISFIGQGTAASRIRRDIAKIAELDSTVLISGESGVGKGLVARLIHAFGPREAHPFVTVSCTALPRELIESELFGHEKGSFTGAHERRAGRLEVADEGTVFLDEIGDMTLDLQPKLLHFLQERSFHRLGGTRPIDIDVRVISATHQDLRTLCLERRFREDLYFRLNVLPLYVPPLRERREDIPLLADYILGNLASRRRHPGWVLDDEALEALLRYGWPGNVRELENVLERTTAFSESSRLGRKDLPPEVRGGEGRSVSVSLAGIRLKELERIAIRQTLEMCQGNKAAAARALGISEKTIYNKLK